MSNQQEFPQLTIQNLAQATTKAKTSMPKNVPMKPYWPKNEIIASVWEDDKQIVTDERKKNTWKKTTLPIIKKHLPIVKPQSSMNENSEWTVVTKGGRWLK